MKSLTQATTSVPYNPLKPLFHCHSTLFQSIEKNLPFCMSLTRGLMPIENFRFFSVLPKTQSNQDNNPFPFFFTTNTMTFINLTISIFLLNSHPNSITLDDIRYLIDWLFMIFLRKKLNLVDTLVDRA